MLFLMTVSLALLEFLTKSAKNCYGGKDGFRGFQCLVLLASLVVSFFVVLLILAIESSEFEGERETD